MRARAPVEGFGDAIALGIGDFAVHEARSDELDVGAGTGQRRGQGAVERWRLGRWIDDLNAHT